MANTASRAREAVRTLGDVPTQLIALDAMTVAQLAEKFRELYGEPTHSRNRDYLRKRLAWRIQELSEGGLSERTLTKIVELGDQLPERWRKRHAAPEPPAPSASPSRDPRLPPTGTVLTRVFDRRSHQVTVGEDGFDYAGQTFKTLSAVARRITGTAWNGFTFFGLTGAAERRS
jgi:Protein of unknown function (DUF2924)